MSAAEAQQTRGLEELRAQDADRFGGKSASLGELLHAGIPVPPGFAISSEAGEELHRHIAPRYRDAIWGVGGRGARGRALQRPG